ncbi:MAG: protocatechuate 3,4-dioxygenase subunit beta [Gemmatimonadetes bacterium]|nr:protocatechuate 3,4-dioxygenase subunit beta [Gemmatimonadota bacterium]
MPETLSLSLLDRSVHPPYLHPPYTSTVKRAPHQPLVPARRTLSDFTAPVFGQDAIRALDHDLTSNAVRNAPPIGERLIIVGTVRDDGGRPVRGALVELWQANASGRYVHKLDQHDAPLDPNFNGAGRTLTDERGEYRFITIRPGAYPWRNHANAWRPAHIHFSIFGDVFLSRLVTQMYFPSDPLLPFDPIYNGIPDPAGRERLIAVYDHGVTQPDYALGYRFDIVLCGSRMTPFENRQD